MVAALKRCSPYFLLLCGCAAMTAAISDTADWAIDAQPAIDSLVGGRVADYLRAEALMGPVSTLVQAPFVWLSPGGEVEDYRWAAYPCLVACGLAGLYLARISRRKGASLPVGVVIATVSVLNPLTVEALRNGHPEELLTAALAVAAVASAAEDRRGRAAVLLGLAITSKQWALIAVLPTLMAISGERVRTAILAGAVVLVLTLPAVIASPSAFFEVHSTAAGSGDRATPWSVWYPLAQVEEERYRVGGETLSVQAHETPGPTGSLAHPAIVLLALAVPLAVAFRRRSLQLEGGEAMAMLAVLALLRCLLDPVDALYYHVPLLLALVGWDAFAPSRLPLRTLAAWALATVAWDVSQSPSDPFALSLVYVAIALVALWAIMRSLLSRRPVVVPGAASGLLGHHAPS